MNAPTPPSESLPASNGRRHFLTLFAGVTALGAVPFAARLAGRPNGTPPAALPGLAAFAPHIGSLFSTAATDSQPALRFTLAKAEAIMPLHSGSGGPFSLRFTAPPGHLIENRIHRFQHPVLGSLELFITPVGSASKFGEPQKGEAVVCLA